MAHSKTNRVKALARTSRADKNIKLECYEVLNRVGFNENQIKLMQNPASRTFKDQRYYLADEAPKAGSPLTFYGRGLSFPSLNAVDVQNERRR